MMIELGRAKRQVIQSICEGSRDVLLRGAAEGAIGRVWVPHLTNPSYCLVVVGDFAYLLGLPPRGEKALDLKGQIFESAQQAFLYPQDERWADWLEEQFPAQLRIVTRYALKKDEHHFDLEKLRNYVKSVPKGVRIRRIDERLYHQVMREEWSRDLCSNFDTAERFLEYAFGYVALKGRELIAGCSCYGVSEGMMEIEVDTRKDWRRQGLALACSAAFVLECLDKGLVPNWDAVNLQSVGLAEKLGYVFEREYQVYRLKEMEER